MFPRRTKRDAKTSHTGSESARHHGRYFRRGRDAGKMPSGIRIPPRAAGDGGDGGRGVRKTSARAYRSRYGHGENSRVPDSRDSQRPQSCRVHGDKIPARAALSERHSLPAKAFRAGAEGRSDEGPEQFRLPRKNPFDGESARVARN